MPSLLTEVQFEIEMVLDFSFIYGGIRYFGRDLPFIDAGSEEICRLHSLKITRRHRYYESGEETCYSFENAGETDSLLLESICDADGIVSVPDSAFHGEATGSVIRLFGAKGSDWSRLEFTPFSNELVQGESLYFSGSGGRPSQSVLPFLISTAAGKDVYWRSVGRGNGLRGFRANRAERISNAEWKT